MSPSRLALCAGIPLLLLPAAAGSPLRVVLPDENPTGGWVEAGPLSDSALQRLRGLDDAELSAILTVRVDVVVVDSVPDMLGEVRLVDASLRFTPRFPWRPGLDYRATLRLPGQPPEALAFRVPEVEAEASTVVTRVFPAGESIPANLLRFYVEFSAPMAGQDALPFVELIDEAGQPIEQPFVETSPLWDPGRTRLTLICHPGRIKRGLDLHDRLGPPLREGMRVALVVKAELEDAWGQPLAAAARREFRVVSADRESPNPATWKLHRPEPGSRDLLRVEFGETLDAQLVERMLSLRDVDGEGVASPDGSAWEFRPTLPWPDGRAELLVAGELEDLSGNRVDAPFEQGDTAAAASGPFVLRIELTAKNP